MSDLVLFGPHYIESTVLYITHWGPVTHICVSKLTVIGSDNGLSPDRRQAIILTNAGLLLIGPLQTNFSEILIEILTFSFKKMRLKVSSAKRRPFCLGLNVIMRCNGKDRQTDTDGQTKPDIDVQNCKSTLYQIYCTFDKCSAIF